MKNWNEPNYYKRKANPGDGGRRVKVKASAAHPEEGSRLALAVDEARAIIAERFPYADVEVGLDPATLRIDVYATVRIAGGFGHFSSTVQQAIRFCAPMATQARNIVCMASNAIDKLARDYPDADLSKAHRLRQAVEFEKACLSDCIAPAPVSKKGGRL